MHAEVLAMSSLDKTMYFDFEDGIKKMSMRLW